MALLVLGLLLDNVLQQPQTMYENWRAKRAMVKHPNEIGLPPFYCHSQGYGCFFDSHAWWHVLSLVSALVQTTGREYAIAATALS